jgi:mediator of RNA polymerase II transcription subunit 25
LHWLSSIQFGGGGFNEVATAEGLAEALMVGNLISFHL